MMYTRACLALPVYNNSRSAPRPLRSPFPDAPLPLPPSPHSQRPDHDKVSGVQRLVKAYQDEIDALTKRCRASDTAFFSLYKSLYQAPDPAQALEQSANERPRAAASEVRACGGGVGRG